MSTTHDFLPAAADPELAPDDRARLACDLHDGPGQVFVAIGLIARGHALRRTVDPETAAVLERVAQLAESGRIELGHLSQGLLLEPGRGRDLSVALHELADEIADDAAITVDVLAQVSKEDRLTDEEERVLFRIAREALTNAWRHGRCSRASITLWVTRRSATVRVADDGNGVDGDLQEGTGIMSMRRALAPFDGELVIAVGSTGGVAVEAHIPRSGV